jgi:hypothetical protein
LKNLQESGREFRRRKSAGFEVCMKSFWREWPSLKRTIAAQKRLMLLLDFDGTLSPLAETPSTAKLPPQVRRLLRQLVSLPGVHVAVISGRSVAYLRRTIRLATIFYSGNHGLEMAGPRDSYCHPNARRFRALIRHWANSWRHSVDRIPGAFLENKGISLSLHYRCVAPRHLQWRQIGRVPVCCSPPPAGVARPGAPDAEGDCGFPDSMAAGQEGMGSCAGNGLG